MYNMCTHTYARAHTHTAIKRNLTMIVSRILVKHVNALISKIVPKHIRHELSDKMAEKSEVAVIDVLHINETCNKDA